MEKRIEFVEAQSENSVSVRDWGAQGIKGAAGAWVASRETNTPAPLDRVPRRATSIVRGVATGNQSASARRARFKAKWR